MSEFRILDQNYAFDSLTAITATSEDANFPVSNLTSYHRSKVWRSSGYFVIDSTNNKLDFKESGGGAELTATLSSGDYTPDELEIEIKSALEAAGAETYTVSFSTTTGKWTIASGGAYLALLRSTGTNVATSAWTSIGFTTAADSTGAVTYTGANIAIHTVERIVFDLASTEEIDSFALLFNPRTGEGNKFSSGATLYLKGSATDSWASPGVSVALSVDSTYEVITHFFASAESYRYWAVEIVDPANANLYVEVPKVVLCKATQLTQGPEIGFTYQSSDKSRVSETPYGHRYADIYPQLRALDFNYAALSAADVETLEGVFRRVGKVKPVAIALDPTATLFDKDRFFAYGYLSGDMKTSHRYYSYFDSGLSFEESG